MPALFYRDFYITVRVVRDGVFSGRYGVFSDVRQRQEGPPRCSFFTSGRFDTEDEAYEAGLEQAKNWIDNRQSGD